jgi:hypothetical protein
MPKGILVEGNTYPIVKMPWVNEPTLGAYLENHYADSNKTKALLSSFQAVIRDLEGLGIAHGDLQHGNILVADKGIRLIDYDGMYVPTMPKLLASEKGHVNYQSPARIQGTAVTVGPHLDRFSAIAIALALQGLAQNPNLWTKYSSGGENILFRAQDYIEPSSSQVLDDISRLPGLSQQVAQFRAICKAPLDKVPSLEDFLGARVNLQGLGTVQVSQQPKRYRQYDVLEASKPAAILKREGDRVEVIGLVTAVKQGRVKWGAPFAFVNFGDYRAKSFTLVLWSGAVGEFQRAGFDLDSLRGSWVSVTGLIQSYNGTPQIEIERPAEIVILKDKNEALALLAAPTVTSPPLSKNQQLKDVFRQYHGDRNVAEGTTQTVPVTTFTGSTAQPPSPRPTTATRSTGKNQEIRKKLTASAGQSFPQRPPISPTVQGQSMQPTTGVAGKPLKTGPLPAPPMSPKPVSKQPKRAGWIALGFLVFLVLMAIIF